MVFFGTSFLSALIILKERSSVLQKPRFAFLQESVTPPQNEQKIKTVAQGALPVHRCQLGTGVFKTLDLCCAMFTPVIMCHLWIWFVGHCHDPRIHLSKVSCCCRLELLHYTRADACTRKQVPAMYENRNNAVTRMPVNIVVTAFCVGYIKIVFKHWQVNYMFQSLFTVIWEGSVIKEVFSI